MHRDLKQKKLILSKEVSIIIAHSYCTGSRPFWFIHRPGYNDLKYYPMYTGTHIQRTGNNCFLLFPSRSIYIVPVHCQLSRTQLHLSVSMSPTNAIIKKPAGVKFLFGSGIGRWFSHIHKLGNVHIHLYCGMWQFRTELPSL